MNVLVKNMQSGRAPVTQFFDNFNRANASSWGEDYIFGGAVYSGAFSALGPNGIDTNRAQWSASAVLQAQAVPLTFFPIPIINGVFGRSQFSSFLWVSGNSISGTRQLFIGPSVCGGWTGGEFRQYLLQITIDNVNSFLSLQKFSGGILGTLQNFAAGTATAGSVYRLEADLTNAGQVTLDVLKDNVSLGTVVDNSGTQARDGLPGASRCQYASNAAPGVSQINMDDLRCGLLI